VVGLVELRERLEDLRGQLELLPTQTLQRIEDLDQRALRLAEQHALVTRRLDELSEPTRRPRRDRDPHATERAHLARALGGCAGQLEMVLKVRTLLVDELGDPGEVWAERDGLERTILEVSRECDMLRDQLVQRDGVGGTLERDVDAESLRELEVDL